MLGNLHVRFGVGAGVKLPRLHHLGGNTQGHLARCAFGRGELQAVSGK